jgi:hypothetical protein
MTYNKPFTIVCLSADGRSWDPETLSGTGHLSLIPFPHRLLCPPPPLLTPLYSHPSSWLPKLPTNACVLSRLLLFQFTESAQLSKEYVAMQKEPPPFVWAAPDEKDILTCALNLSHVTI